MSAAVSNGFLNQLSPAKCDSSSVDQQATTRPYPGMDIRRIVGANVRALREERELSQEELGFEAGIDRTYVSGVERGVRNPTITVLERLAKGLKVDPAVLLQRTPRR